jgi:hypothetical protein
MNMDLEQRVAALERDVVFRLERLGELAEAQTARSSRELVQLQALRLQVQNKLAELDRLTSLLRSLGGVRHG